MGPNPEDPCFVRATFPEPSKWISFEDLVHQYTDDMAEKDSSAEIADVQTAVHSVADMSGGLLDPYVSLHQHGIPGPW